MRGESSCSASACELDSPLTLAKASLRCELDSPLTLAKASGGELDSPLTLHCIAADKLAQQQASGAQFTCFTSTKVHILTPAELVQQTY